MISAERLAELKQLAATLMENPLDEAARMALFPHAVVTIPRLISAYEKLQEENESFKKEACQWRSRFLDLEIQSLETIQKYFAVVDAAKVCAYITERERGEAIEQLKISLQALDSGEK